MTLFSLFIMMTTENYFKNLPILVKDLESVYVEDAEEGGVFPGFGSQGGV